MGSHKESCFLTSFCHSWRTPISVISGILGKMSTQAAPSFEVVAPVLFLTCRRQPRRGCFAKRSQYSPVRSSRAELRSAPVAPQRCVSSANTALRSKASLRFAAQSSALRAKCAAFRCVCAANAAIFCEYCGAKLRQREAQPPEAAKRMRARFALESTACRLGSFGALAPKELHLRSKCWGFAPEKRSFSAAKLHNCCAITRRSRPSAAR